MLQDFQAFNPLSAVEFACPSLSNFSAIVWVKVGACLRRLDKD